MNAEALLPKLSLRFGLFAIASAVLVGLGQKSSVIPVLVTFCFVFSWIFTDRLGIIVMHRYLAYVAMISGAALAIREYVITMDLAQLLPISNLLVYVQLPLFFQRKSQRIFEQLGVFLLLELIVAALVNDEVFFGLLLLPCLVLGCMAMMTFSEYVSCLNSNKSRRESEFRWRDLWRDWTGRDDNSDQTGQASVPKSLRLDNESAPASPIMLGAWSAIPLSMAFVFFAICHFFFLPRLHSGSFHGNSAGQTRVGYDGTMSLQDFGRLAVSDEPALRLTLRQRETGKYYQPQSAPYLRGVVLGQYRATMRRGDWSPIGSDYNFYDERASTPNPVPRRSEIAAGFLEGTDDVIIEVKEEAAIGASVIEIPPFYQVDARQNFRFLNRTLSLTEPRRASGVLRRYRLGTVGFINGLDSKYLPVTEDLLGLPIKSVGGTQEPPLPPTERELLTRFQSEEFPSLIKMRDEWLERWASETSSRVDQALFLENFMAESGELTYALELATTPDSELDPVEDFIRNQKQGHCQYFASSLALMLRSLGVPTRIVVGFHPSEYNQIGNCYFVRQSHAHAWVEAFFSREEFDGSSILLPAAYQRGAWMRLDPTPSGEGTNTGQELRGTSMQSLEFAQRWWKDYVLDMDRNKQGQAFDLFGDTSRNAYQSYWESIERFLSQLSDDDDFEESQWPRLFSWPMLAAITIATACLCFVIRAMKRVWGRKSSMVSKAASQRRPIPETPVVFIRGALQSLARAGWHRPSSATIPEFFGQLATTADSDGSNATRAYSESLQWLVQLYNRMRYSGKDEWSRDEQMRSEDCLRVIDERVQSWLARESPDDAARRNP